jgi:hypothetical protein
VGNQLAERNRVYARLRLLIACREQRDHHKNVARIFRGL